MFAGEGFSLKFQDFFMLIFDQSTGELIGAFFLGPIGDIFGRKPSFIISCALIAVFGLLSAISPSYGWMLFFRAMVGSSTSLPSHIT